MNASSAVSGNTGRSSRYGRRAQHSTSFDLAIRVGLVFFGVIHLLVAWLALQLSWGRSDGQASGSGALQELAQKPFGAVLLWAVGIGFFALVVWQLLDATIGHTNSDGLGRVARRVGSGLMAMFFGAVGILAIRTAAGSGGGDSSEETLTARLMSVPGGQVLVAVVALGIVCVGIVQIGMAISGAFLDNLTARGQSRGLGTAVTVLGRAGYASKGVAVIILGGLCGWAAVTHDSEKAGGIDEALGTVLDQPFGPYLLTVVALGIGCFGVFCFVWSRHLDRET